MRLSARAPFSGLTDAAAIGAAAFVLSLRTRGIRSTEVLGAMERVPRELFAPRRFTDLARRDVALPLPCGQTMTGPATVAAMLVALEVEPGQRVLEIGTGSGYVTALLVRLEAEVISVERYRTLARSATEHLKIFGAGKAARVEVADGLAARPRDRFHRILVNGAAAAIPPALTSLLPPGGRLIGAVAGERLPRLLRIDRLKDGSLKQEVGPALRIGPMAPGAAASL